MASEVEPLLRSLHACWRGGEPQYAAHKANDIIGDIRQICLEDVTAKQAALCCANLFHKDSGAMAFIKRSAGTPEYQSCIVDLLGMLLAFLQKYKSLHRSYLLDIKDGCMSTFSRDKSAKVKVAAIAFLVEAVLESGKSHVGDELQAGKMMEKFFMELVTASKHPSSVKQQIYHLLGTMAEVYPEYVVNYSDRLVQLYLRTLKTEMTSKTRKPEMLLIAGCLRGLTHLLANFTQSAAEDSKHSYEIYKYTRMALDPGIDHSRYEMPRAALLLLARHGAQFAPYMLDEYEKMYGTLLFWSRHHNSDVLHHGIKAMENFLQQISESLVARSKQGIKDSAIFKFFICKFREIIDNPSSSTKEISMAIQGYGFLAAPCKSFLSADDVKFMFNEMIQQSEQIFFSQQENTEEKLMNLSSFLQALASIVAELDEVSETFVWSLERLVVMMMEIYPKLHRKLHYRAFISIAKVLIALLPSHATFTAFLSHIVYQGLIRSCSHQLILEVEESSSPSLDIEETMRENQRITYADYVPLWKSLLSCYDMKELLNDDIGRPELRKLSAAIYDELLTAIMTMIKRLDLTSLKDGETNISEEEAVPGTSTGTASPETVTSDQISGLAASRPQDFTVFINLVDLVRDLLLTHHTEQFLKWVFIFGHEIILLSTRLPLVSGFYKLLALCMQICRKTAYFKEVDCGITGLKVKREYGVESTVEKSELMEVDDEMKSDLPQREACFLLFSKVTGEVLLRLKQYKDDLLASCLTFVLSVPAEVAVVHIESIVTALQMSFQLGRSYLVIANVGLDALEYYSHTLPLDMIDVHYEQILPFLDPYLRSGTQLAEEDDSMLTVTSSKPNKKAGRKKIPIKLLKQKKNTNAAQTYETQLTQVRHRCVMLLGSLGGRINNALLTRDPAVMAKQGIAWDTVKHLKFDIPFIDIKPVIYFDPFLSRVVELAATSSDRQTKVAACELLHALIVYMLGRAAQQPGSRVAGEPMEALYRRVFPVVLQLACDVEQVSRQLFEPLMFQLIHWFTNNKKFESEDTMALLDTLMDGVVCPTDAARRDFSAKCIREFLIWSIKQVSQQKLEKSPINIKSLLKRLYSLAAHPSAFKRLGASLAFNNIYDVFREEASLVDKYIFEILVHYVESLALAHHDNKSLGTQEQCKLVLGHLERIIKAKKDQLNKVSKNRVNPKNWNEATLQLAVRWLLRQCGRPHTECRHACMNLVHVLAPCISNYKTTQAFFAAYLKDGTAKYYIDRFEAANYKGVKSGLLRAPTMDRVSDLFGLKAALGWFDMVLATLDCYTWVFGMNLLKPTDVLMANQGSVVFRVLGHFFTQLALNDISGAAKLFSSHDDLAVFTPSEVDRYNHAKCTIIVRILNFLCCLLSSKTNLKVIPSELWSDSLWETVVSCILQPTVIGFNMGDVEIMRNLPSEVEKFLQLACRSLPQNNQKNLIDCIASKLTKKGGCDLFGQLPLNLRDMSADFVHLRHLVAGFQQLQRTGLLLSACKKKASDCEILAKTVMKTVYESLTYDNGDEQRVIPLSPTAYQLAENLIELAFLLGLPASAVVDLFLDDTPLPVSSTTSSHRGTTFYAAYRSTLNTHLITMATAFIPTLMRHASKQPVIVGNVMSSLLDQISCDRALRKKVGTSVVELVMKEWTQIKSWWTKSSSSEIKQQALTLLAKVIVIDSKAVVTVDKEWFTQVFDMYRDMLNDSTTSLGFKCQVLDFLVFFTSLPEKQTEDLKDQLDRFVTENFPMRSSEYEVGSPKYNDFISALDKILNAFELSGSLMLLQLVISIMCREERHIHEDAIQASFVTFVKRLPRDRQKLALDVPYKIYCNEAGFPIIIRRSSLERVALSLLHRVHSSALIEFYLEHIKDIMVLVEAKSVKGSDAAVEMQMTTKLCAFQLIEVMYSRLPKSEVSSMDSRINNKYCNGIVTKGNEMTNSACKCANAARSEDIRAETTLLELRRQYHCAAYNALIAVLSCTQTQLKFYTGLLFADNPAKGQFLFENILDIGKSYTFCIQMEKPLERRKRFVSVRSEARERRLQDAGDASEDYVSSSVHYLASHYLNSSLSTDVSNFDFGTSAVSASVFSGSSISGSLGRRSSSKQQSLKSKKSEPEVMVSDDYVEMEMDELNQHECMAALTGLLQHMHRNNITPKVEKGSSPSEMPPWMTFLHKKMNESTTPINIKLFIAKLIINTQAVFAGYAKFWLSPLTQLVVSGEMGEGIHYFLSDLIITMLAWNSYAIPEDTTIGRAMASRLCDYLMNHCHHSTRQIFRSNLEIIKTLVEVWKSRIDPPTRVIYQNFSKPVSETDKDVSNSTGIQLLGVILANQLPPYSPGCGVEKDKFFRQLSMNMKHPLKAVHAAAAEVVGMALKVTAEKEKGDAAADWRNSFLDCIVKILCGTHQAKRPDIFITCIHLLTKHYPPAAEKFISNVLFMLPKMHGELQMQCLEIITSCVDQIENVFTEMKDKGLVDSMEHRDEVMQKAAVQLVHGMLPRLKPDQLLYLLPAVEKVASCSSGPARHGAYDVFMWVYDNYKDDESSETAQILTITKDCLLRGLSDSDLENRLMVENFWSTGDRLPGSTVERLVAMLEAMYSPRTEHYYLSYATSLLLRATTASPDFNRVVFEHPLSECKFEDYNVVSSWRQRHMAMTPLFVATQVSQSVSSTVDESLGSGQVRATQETHQFTPTQEQGGDRRYNWLTQSTMDTYADLSLSLASMDTQSSLLFTIGRGPKASSRVGEKSGPGAGKAKVPAVKTDEADSGNSDILRLKRRFLKDQSQSKVFFMKRHSRLNRLREEAKAERKQRRENQVTMYRKYRIGDLPDIQIKYSALIAPLQALAQRDANLARLLFASVFRAIAADIEEVKTDREVQETYSKINDSLNMMLTSSTRYFPHFIGCILDIAYHFPRQVKLDASSLNTACVTSLQQPLGIMVLEEQLIRELDVERPAKKARGRPENGSHTSIWIEVARLYKSVDEYDVVCGIFSSQFHERPNTTKAIDAEMMGYYQDAIKLYNEASKESLDGSEDPSEVEQDFWDESRLQCYAELTQWDKLEEFIEGNIDDRKPARLDVVWDSTYYQELYLPKLIQCKLKLLFEEGDGQQELLDFIERAMLIRENQAVLENRYGTELALIYLWQEQYERAQYYEDQSITAFLENWSSMNSLMYSSRQNTLQQLQSLVEIQEFLKFVKYEDNFTSRKPAEKLVSCWLGRKPDAIIDRVQVWDDVVTNRCVYLDRIADKLENAGILMASDDCSIFEREQVLLRLSMAESAWQQDNFTVAMKKLRVARQIKLCKEDEQLNILWSHTYARTHNRRSKVAQISFDEKIEGLTGTLKQLDKFRGSDALVPSLHQQQGLLKGEAYHILVTLLQKHQGDGRELGAISAEHRAKLVTLSNKDSKELQQVVCGLIEKGYSELKMAVSRATDEDHTDGRHGDRMVSDANAAHLAMVKFCDDFLHQQEEVPEGSVGLDFPSLERLPSTMVHSLLTAMKNGSVEARQRFPRLLQIIDLHPDTIGLFKDEVAKIPSWMFLGWVSQITAILDKPESPAIHKLLLDMAQLYPQAVVYPFKLSCDGYKFGPDRSGKENQNVKNKLEEVLSKHKLIDALISALEQFGQPNALFTDYMNDDINKLLMRKVGERSKSAILQKYREMYDELIGATDSEHDLYDSQTSTQGSVPIKIGSGKYRKKFAKEYGKHIVKEFGLEGDKLVNMSLKEFTEKKNKLIGKMRDDVRTTLKPPGTLSEYSEWLANFEASNFDYDLEIPGQYTGTRKPLAEYHTKISSFDPRVLVLKSLRMPKRLTIRGNDECEYSFLVKGGEDLRQDLRIEQLFMIMNDIYKRDPAARQRNLQLRTYQVIPMTARVGMIEWMNKTMPMKEFFYSAMTPEELRFVNSNKGPADDHFKFIGGAGSANYNDAYKRKSRTDTEVAFRRRQESVPWDLFRRGLMNLSANLEAYFMLRNNAAISHAVVCISQYILGIGDRHLSNFMIALDSGFVCGIDFGHAFGTATQFLPIPELMPFRYTRQIRNLTMPLREKGLVEGTMIHALRALRNHSDLLLATMDVFIKEPSLDWQQFAEKQQRTMKAANIKIEEDEGIDGSWYPRQKVEYARRKLLGDNSAHIMKKELTLGHHRSPVYKDMLKVLMGDKQKKDKRAELNEKGLRVDEQVACLLNHATDPNILGRVWAGWESFM